VTVSGPRTVVVQFNEALGTGADVAANYAVSGSGRGTLAANPNTVAAGGTSATLTWNAGEMTIGGDIVITAGPGVQDAAGNAMGVPADGTAAAAGVGERPTVASITRLTPASEYTNSDGVTWRVTFSENVSGIAYGDFTVTQVSGSNTGFGVGSVNNASGLNLNVTAGPTLDGSGVIRLDVLAASATIVDDAGNALTADFTGGATYACDKVAPAVVAPADFTTSDTTPTVSSTASDDNSGVASISIALNSKNYGATVAQPGALSTSWSANVTDALTGTDPTTYPVTITVTDRAGNTGTGSFNIEKDTRVPETTVANLTTSDTTPDLSGTAVTKVNRDLASVNVTVNGKTYAAATSGTKPNFTWTLTIPNGDELTDGVYAVSAEAVDGIGLAGTGPAGVLTIDTTPPQAEFELLDPAATPRNSVRFHVTFDEAVLGDLETGEVSLAAGSLAGGIALSGSAGDYTITVTMTDAAANGTVAISIAADALTDALGNSFTGADSPAYTIYNWPGFSSQPEAALKEYEGGSLSLAVAGNFGPITPTFQWKWNDGSKAEQDGAAAATWLLTNLATANQGEYWCAVTFDNEVYESAHSQLEVKPELTITSAPVDVTKANDDSHTFTVAATGGYEPLSYQWKLDGTTIQGATNDNYNIATISADKAGLYTVEVSDSNTASATASARLTVSAGVPVAALPGLALMALAAAAAGARALRRK
jgi:hypothetical protein